MTTASWQVSPAGQSLLLPHFLKVWPGRQMGALWPCITSASVIRSTQRHLVPCGPATAWSQSELTPTSSMPSDPAAPVALMTLSLPMTHALTQTLPVQVLVSHWAFRHARYWAYFCCWAEALSPERICGGWQSLLGPQNAPNFASLLPPLPVHLLDLQDCPTGHAPQDLLHPGRKPHWAFLALQSHGLPVLVQLGGVAVGSLHWVQ